MSTPPRTLGRRLWLTLSSIRNGIILLIVVVVISAAGTLILQRPLTDPEQMERAYSPQMLRWMDLFGLTDVFHAWWFITLLVLVSLSIVCASIDRFPNAWRFFARPYRVPDQHFRAVLPLQEKIPISSPAGGLAAAERALTRDGFKPERIVGHDQVSLYAERHRFSVMAVYIVHASLLLIFLGVMVDGLVGYRGYLQLAPGQSAEQIQLRSGGIRPLPFALRCDGAGQQNYPDGTPKRWWSKLAVLENGREVLRKEIAVNDPLTYRGVRFFQSGYGATGKVERVTLGALKSKGGSEIQNVVLTPGETVRLDANTTVQLAEFIPDFVVRDGAVYTRSLMPENPALHLVVASAQPARAFDVWMPPIAGIGDNAQSPYDFEARDLEMEHFTGLQVASEPGQWLVWGGCLLLAVGLGIAFYLTHMRLWILPIEVEPGRLVLWVGGTANKNREVFAGRFHRLVEEIRSQVAEQSAAPQEERESVPAGR
jgi:cytochrome c biogenesis protein